LIEELEEHQKQNLSRGWTWTILKSVSQVISGYSFNSHDFIEEGTPVIKIANISYGKFTWKQQEFLPIDFNPKYSEYQIFPETLLIALTRPITENKVKVCLYPSDAPIGLLNQRVAMLKPHSFVSKLYLFYLLQSEFFKTQIKNGMSETLQPNLSPLNLEKGV
jgi:type I restriction enzyme S subunit